MVPSSEKLHYTKWNHSGHRKMHTVKMEDDIPLAHYPPTYKDYRHKVDAALAALSLTTPYMEHLDDDVPVEDLDEIHNKFAEVALTNSPTAPIMVDSPQGLLHIKTMLTEYDYEVVQSAAQLRRYVTNKLIEESSHPDARIRMKALELLGKVSDVGLFTEKTEVTLRHRPTEELEQLLRERLTKIIDMDAAPVPLTDLSEISPV